MRAQNVKKDAKDVTTWSLNTAAHLLSHGHHLTGHYRDRQTGKVIFCFPPEARQHLDNLHTLKAMFATLAEAESTGEREDAMADIIAIMERATR